MAKVCYFVNTPMSKNALLVSGLASLVLVLGCSTRANEGDAQPKPCTTDSGEDGQNLAAELGTFQDDAEFQKEDEGGKSRRIQASLHDGADVDRYRGTILDRGFSGNPSISVIVSDGFRVTGTFVCSNGGPAKTQVFSCGVGTIDRPDAALEATTCTSASSPPQFTLQLECDDTSTEDGTLELTVERESPADACAAYELSVWVE